MEKITLFWFRRDLRLQDNCGLYHALNSDFKVLPIFIFDIDILDDLDDQQDPRVDFIHGEMDKINHELHEKGTSIQFYYSSVQDAFEKLCNRYEIGAVYCNKDYEPYAIKRDLMVKKLLEAKGISFHSFKDQVIFEENEVTKDDGEPYLVYTPYSKKWLSQVSSADLESYSSALRFSNWYPTESTPIIPLAKMGFSPSKISIPNKTVTDHTLSIYEEERNIPAKDSTSKLGVHLRFGTISIRQLCQQSSEISLSYYKELIWREFFMMILFHFPHVVDQNYNSKYDGIKWRNNPEEFEKWCQGKTGFPLVDAGMRELNQTGFMHNRVRMLVASFLCKHLLIDWKWGEAYFAKKLLDYELASNNGNWQWCAGTGVDASPYFRVFNPSTQLEKFDKNKTYVKRWIPEYGTDKYPSPMVDHKKARERAITTYKESFKN